MRDGSYTLITGGAGFIGSNLADALCAAGERVVIADTLARDGVRHNVEWLRETHGDLLQVEVADVRDAKRIGALVLGARQVFHLAAQVAVTTSVEDPAHDLETNLLGTFHILEAARQRSDPPPIVFTSTNKVYGGLDHIPVERWRDEYRYADGRGGIDEDEALDFHSPYGCSKGAADQYVRDYSRVYGIPTAVFRMSCIYGTRQFGTEDQGWVAHFARSLLAGTPITVFGDGYQVRDVLWVGDLVAALRTAMQEIDSISGEIFNIGGGMSNAVSVRGVIDRLIEVTGREVPILMAPWRPGDQRVYVSDAGKAQRMLDWQPEVCWQEGLVRLVEWLEDANLGTPVHPLRNRQAERQPAMMKAAP